MTSQTVPFVPRERDDAAFWPSLIPVQSIAPPTSSRIWLDTSSTPATFKAWDGDRWAPVVDASQRLALARTPEALIAGAITRDANGAATAAPVVWPDNTPGTYTALELSAAFPGAVDSYQITYGSPAAQTYTQPTITRDATGAATTVPAIIVT